MRILGIAFIVLACLLVACDDDGAGSTAGPDDAAITVGALLPLSGSLSSYGETSEAALKVAVETINEEHPDQQVRLIIEDTETDPEAARAAIERLHDEDVRLIVGPYASSTLTEVKDYADENGLILISPLSTARSLAVPDDNIFRFTPDDDKEGVAVAALAWEDGIRTILPVSRDDPGNLGLQAGMKAAFEPMGGAILEGITYPAEETDFEDEVQQLVELLASAHAEDGEVAIYLTAFAEVTDLFNATIEHEELSAAQWYGSDSVALSADLIEDETAAAFAQSAGYPNPILGLSDSDRALWQPVQSRLAEELDRQIDAFALAAYDALMVGYEALVSTGEGDIEALKKAVVEVAEGHQGLTGSTRLNDAGDRDIAIYDFWAVCERDGEYVWIRAASYIASATGEGGAITRPETCE